MKTQHQDNEWTGKNVYSEEVAFGGPSKPTVIGPDGLITTPSIQLDTTAPEPEHAVGLLHWNSEDEMPEIGMTGGNVNQQVGGEIFVPRRVQNKTDSDMTNGQLVFISGGSGNNAYVELANADSELTSRRTIGMLTEDIAKNAKGWVTTYGLVRDVDTDGMDIGAELFLDTSDGGYTTDMPDHPNTSVSIGTVFRAQQNEGVIMVRIVPPTMAKCVAGGDGAVWDDLRFPFIGRNLDTASGRIDYNYAELGVDFATNARYNVAEQISMIVQFPHHWLMGSDISPHIHWMQKADNSPNFMIEYRWYNIGETPPAWTQAIAVSQARPYVSGTIHQLTDFPVITPPVDIDGVSSILDVKFFRDVANDSGLFLTGAEVGPAVELVKEFDIHYQVDSLGSRSEYLK